MGQALPTAVLTTIVDRDGNETFRVGTAETNGWRGSMEDAHVIEMRKDWGFFGVLDGHGGQACSKWCAEELHKRLQAQGCPVDDAAAKKLILKVDEDYLATNQPSGSAATFCVARPRANGKFDLHVINAGDSRVLLGKRDGSIVDGGGTDQGLTRDHKPDDPGERARIERCGGTVEMAYGGVARVNGELALSRGFGDASHKQTGGPAQEDRPVTADPEMGHFQCDQADFVLLVCDGVSEGSFPNPEVVEFVADVLKETNDPGEAARRVCLKAVECNSRDNVSCMVVLFEKGQTMPREFNAGPLTSPDNSGWMKAFKQMAERGGFTPGQAVGLRYETLMEQVAKGDRAASLPVAERQAAVLQAEEARQELHRCEFTTGDQEGKSGASTVPGTKGSAERAAFFEQWAEKRLQASPSNPGDMASQLAAGAAGGNAEMMRMFMQMMQRRQQGMDMDDSADDGREVKVAPLATLKAAVDAHSALKWDPRMGSIAGQNGTVKQDDASDGTTQVKFTSPKPVVAWLPTAVLENL